MAQAPQASVRSLLSFETIAFGSNTTLALPVTNSGKAPLTLSASINGPSYAIMGAEPNGCLQGTPAGQICTLTVEFSAFRVGYHRDLLTLQRVFRKQV
jgi:hypothetical protein